MERDGDRHGWEYEKDRGVKVYENGRVSFVFGLIPPFFVFLHFRPLSLSLP